MASRRKEQRENIRFKVIRLISENPDITTRQIAKEVGISNGSAFYLLNALIEKGFVKFGNFFLSPNKEKYSYLLTRKGLKEKYDLTFSFLEYKKREFKELKEEIEILEQENKLALGFKEMYKK